MEFKGTKGKWNWSWTGGDELGILMSDIGVEVMNFGDTTTYYPTAGVEPNNYDAQLIAHAPEMLEKHYEEIEILEGILKNNPIGDMAFKLRMIIETKKDLLTRATTI